MSRSDAQGYLLFLDLRENAIQQGEYSHARTCLLKALEGSRENNSKSDLVVILAKPGDIAFLEADYALMEACFQKCLLVAQETSFPIGVVFSLHHIAVAVRRQGRVQRAAQYLRDSLPAALLPRW